jgi:hypothetical protein
MVIDDCNGTRNVPVLEVPLGSIDMLDILKDAAGVPVGSSFNEN